jgi:hypothetical protein
MAIPLTTLDLTNAIKAKRACYDKVRFTNKKIARQAARRHGLYVYNCPHCGLMHLTKIHPKKYKGEKF